MIFDVAERHQLALDPSSLTSITTTLNAIERAIEDCRNAGVAPDSDPAVVLLARHLAGVSTNRAPRAVLRDGCRRKLATVARFPALLVMAENGVDYDSLAKDRFHSEGRAALDRLAVALDLPRDSYTVAVTIGDRSNSGFVRLTTSTFAVVLRVGGIYRHRELLYRAIRDRREIAPNQYAPLRALLDPGAFAQRLQGDLKLSAPPTSPDAIPALAMASA